MSSARPSASAPTRAAAPIAARSAPRLKGARAISVFTDITTGAGQCTLYDFYGSGVTSVVANAGTTTNANVYALDGIACPPLNIQFKLN